MLSSDAESGNDYAGFSQNPDLNPQDFQDISFYNLMYVAERFSPSSDIKRARPNQAGIDWFGLYD